MAVKWSDRLAPMGSKLTTRAIVLIFWDILSTYIAYLLATIGTGQTDDVFGVPMQAMNLVAPQAQFTFNTDVLFHIGIIAIINVVVFLIARLYNDMWEYASTPETLRIVAAVALATFASALFLFLIGVRFPIRVYFVAMLILLVFVGGGRYGFRFWRYRKNVSRRLSKDNRKRTLIVGAGETGSLTITRMTNGDYYLAGKPVVAVDDDPDKIGMRIHGVTVAGNRNDIEKLVERYKVEQIVLALPSAGRKDAQDIYNICMGTGCRLLTLPNVRDIPIDQLDDVKLRDVSVSDLLARDEIDLNTKEVSGYIAGRTIMVTGGGGSIGSELVRQLCNANPARIIVFDIYENTAYELLMEIAQKHPDMELIIEIGSVRDFARLVAVFNKYMPDVVFHAAAHKHVPLMESCPQEAIRNNVFGTMNVARAAVLHNVKKFIFISTDKAVNPSSVMGATKRLGEMIIQSYSQNSDTIFAAVRFGNVLGSHGSVIPLFKRQITEGGPVTVTHPDMTRYFMTIPEASRLVIQAGGLARGGEIFILDMGEPVKIVDLARNLIRLSGLRPDIDIKIEFTGLRPGEKLSEELWTETEETEATSVKDIMISSIAPLASAEVEQKLMALAESLDGSTNDIKRCLSQQIPTYNPRYYESGDDKVEFD